MTEAAVLWTSMNRGTEIIPDLLWQCGIDELPELVPEVKPQAIVNLAPQDFFKTDKDFSKFKTVESYTKWAIRDGDLPDLDVLDGIVQMVVGHMFSGKRVIVHCAAGLNRSGLVVALAVSDYLDISGAEAIELMRQKRGAAALCNDKFAKYVETGLVL